jgi:hypothetical protein
MEDAETKLKRQNRETKENSIRITYNNESERETTTYALNLVTHHYRTGTSNNQLLCSFDCTLKEFQKHKKDALRIVTEELNREEVKRVKLDKLYPGKTKSEAIRLIQENAVESALK